MYESVCYKQPFLKQVIAKIDFIAPLTAFDKAPSADLTSKISDKFPISESLDITSTSLQFSPGVQPEQHEEKLKQWNFFSKDRQSQISFSSSNVFLLYKKYKNYEDMKASFSLALDLLGNEHKDAIASRFGLRYINTIEGIKLKTATSWKPYINGKLFGTASFFAGEKESHLTRLFHVADMKFDEMDIKFQFGMPNPDFPAVMKRPMFVLDVDAYVETSHKLSEVLSFMDKAHGHIQDIFENSITDKLRVRMNAEQ